MDPRPTDTSPVRGGLIWLTVLCVSGSFHLAGGYHCIDKCEFGSTWSLVAPHNPTKDCMITLPDNPLRQGNITYPCRIEILANCTSFCQVQLTFNKFQLPSCQHNSSFPANHCQHVHSCEYMEYHEQGTDSMGVYIEEYARFHGNMTSVVYMSRTNRILLQFCYRSETFSARNIQVAYKAVDPESLNVRYIGPVSVYVLLSFVVLLLAGIAVVCWCPWLRPCLDPPQEKKDAADFML